MPTFKDLINSLPADTQESIKTLWDSLPLADRDALQSLFHGFPTEANLLRLLVSLSIVEFKMAFGRKERVAIVGPANVGKSTLYNHLIRSKEDRANVSPIPGTTRTNQEADAGLFAIIDTPGADAVGEVGEQEKQFAFHAAKDADFIIIIFDAIQGIKKTEIDLFQEIKTFGKPYLLVLNKMDLVRKEKQQVVEKAAASLSIKPEQILAISAKDNENTEKVLIAIAMTEPAMVAALGRAMPAYRWQLAWRTIVGAASVSAAIALTPLPFIDFAPLVITQSIMVLGIARIYNYHITLNRAKELVITFGLGFLGRTLFQELSKLGGLPGWMLSAAIAASTTVAMGYAASVWFEKGEKLSNESMKILSKQLTTNLINSLRSIGKKKPDRETMQAQMAAALEKTGIGKNPAELNKTETENNKLSPESIQTEIDKQQPDIS